MSAREVPEFDAAAFRLAALLEQYQQDVEPLTAASWSAAVQARLGQELDVARVLCNGVPALSAAWVRLLISSAELAHHLGGEAPDGAAADRCKAEHLLAVRALREECLAHCCRTARDRLPN